MYIQQINLCFPYRHLKCRKEVTQVLLPYFPPFIHSLHRDFSADIILIITAVIYSPSPHRQKAIRSIYFKHPHLIIFFIESLLFNRDLSFHCPI